MSSTLQSPPSTRTVDNLIVFVKPFARLTNEDGVKWFETEIPHLPYNMVMQTRLDASADADQIVERVAGRFRERGVPYIWALHQLDRPDGLGGMLARQGLDLVETVTGMDLDLVAWEAEPSETDAEIVNANYDEGALHEYIELIRTYWSVPESAQKLLETFNRAYLGDDAPGVRLVAALADGPSGSSS